MSETLFHAEAHLRQYAPLERFWIYRTPQTQPGLIHYADSLGKAWVLMEDDEVVLDQCIKVLESKGCPVFDDVSAMDIHAERIATGD